MRTTAFLGTLIKLSRMMIEFEEKIGSGHLGV